MSRTEQALLRRFSGLQILIGGVVIGIVGVGPLLLYIALGPADGNPIGLGLLAVVAIPVAAVVAGVGLIKMLVEYFTRGRD